MKKILVLCTGNSCRSQIAEGYLRYFAGNRAQVYSAGVETHGVNPLAVKTMQQDGIDISVHTSNHVSEYAHMEFDYVITVCDNAREQCPVFPSKAQKVHQNFPDPSRIIAGEEETMKHFASARDEIKDFCREFAERLWLHSAGNRGLQ